MKLLNRIFKALKHKTKENVFAEPYMNSEQNTPYLRETSVPMLQPPGTTLEELKKGYEMGTFDASIILEQLEHYELVDLGVVVLGPEDKLNIEYKDKPVEEPKKDHGKIYAPFTEDQVESLNSYQKSGQFHPFTCCSHEGCVRSEHEGGLLKAREEGWICPCGKWTQKWAWKFMAEKKE